MSHPATRRTFRIVCGIIVVMTMIPVALMTLTWMEGRSILATLRESIAILDTMRE